jgi:hypothetical protein
MRHDERETQKSRQGFRHGAQNWRLVLRVRNTHPKGHPAAATLIARYSPALVRHVPLASDLFPRLAGMPGHVEDG